MDADIHTMYIFVISKCIAFKTNQISSQNIQSTPIVCLAITLGNKTGWGRVPTKHTITLSSR